MARVLIIGASRGIGLALVQASLARGDEVWASARDALPPAGPVGVHWLTGVDVVQEAGRERLLAPLAGVMLDRVIHSAGVLHDDVLGSLDPQSLRTQFEVNALAPVLTAQALLPHLANGARLAFVTSRMGSIADNTSGAHYGYRMSKAALNMAAKSLAVDLEPRGIAVAVLHPGFVRTAMTGGQGLLDADQSARLLLERCDALDLAHTGTFWHANGEALPW